MKMNYSISLLKSNRKHHVTRRKQAIKHYKLRMKQGLHDNDREVQLQIVRMCNMYLDDIDSALGILEKNRLAYGKHIAGRAKQLKKLGKIGEKKKKR